MDLFQMPAELPGTVSELDALVERVNIEIKVIADFAAAGRLIPGDIADHREYLLDSRDALREAAMTLANQTPPAATLEAKPQQGFQLSERLAYAVHEGGHAAINVVLGGEVNAAEVFLHRDGPPIIDRDGRQLNGLCTMVPMSTVTGARGHLIAAAGPAAEAVVRYGRSPTPAQIVRILAGQRDFEDLRRYALTAGAMVTPTAPVREVMPLVLRCWPAIVKLAAQMDDGHQVTHPDVTAALGLSQDRSLHAFEVANIRAGLRAVPQPNAAGVTA